MAALIGARIDCSTSERRTSRRLRQIRPAAASIQLTTKTYAASDFAAAQELFHSRGWTEGLPIVPPTAEAVEACQKRAGLAPDHLIGIEPVTAGTLPKVSLSQMSASGLSSIGIALTFGLLVHLVQHLDSPCHTSGSIKFRKVVL